ncbi:HEAT repeat domain-containing protein [Halorubrum sp. SP3]|uniref:HEAT repeat domain-containing protein n=1 Tax=Halorubrum sp. SP3 TaxID=1537265 RepID=UPI0010F647E6|nr:HEAT repeat domain-containing protein [Halorubrum sp. SP3]TKX54069.1 HEAT repeat domain-containing protein [Halorubrum sp. SP3]
MDDGPGTEETAESAGSAGGAERGDRSASAAERSDRGDGPPMLARLGRRFDASTRREAAEALGNPSGSMSAEQDRIVEALFGAALDDPDEAVRAAAIESLYFHDDDHVDRLARRIAERRSAGGTGDGRRATRGRVAEAFARWVEHDRAAYRMVGATGLAVVGDEGDAPRFREAFDDGDARVRARAVRGYARVGGERVDAVRPLVDAPNDLVRGAAADALVAMDSDDATELLALAARRGNERLRLTVVRRLGALDRRDAAGVLIGSLRDPAERIRRAAAASITTVIARAGAVSAGDVRDRLLTERPFDGDGPLAAFRAVAAERTASERPGPDEIGAEESGADRSGAGGSASAEAGASIDAETRRYAAWLCCELIEAADPTATDRSASVEWLIDALDHRDRLVADLAAAYLPRIVANESDEGVGAESDATDDNRSALGVDVERRLRELASDETAAEDARERARAVLRRFKRAVVETAADRHVEYVYVRWPADYTERNEG